MVKNRPVQGADRRSSLSIAKTRNAEVGDFAPQDAVLRIDQSFLNSLLNNSCTVVVCCLGIPLSLIIFCCMDDFYSNGFVVATICPNQSNHQTCFEASNQAR